MSLANPNQFEKGGATLFPYNTRAHSTAAPVSGSILEFNKNNPAFISYVGPGVSTISLLVPPTFSTGQVSVQTNSRPAASTLFKYIPIASTVVTNVAANSTAPSWSSISGFITSPGAAVPISPNNSTLWGGYAP